MGYAIIDVNGKQFKVSKGKWILVPLLEEEDKDSILLDKVIFFKDQDKAHFGSPYLTNVEVKAKILDAHLKGEKVIVFKHKRSKRYRRKMGFRPKYSKILIDDITLKG